MSESGPRRAQRFALAVLLLAVFTAASAHAQDARLETNTASSAAEASVEPAAEVPPPPPTSTAPIEQAEARPAAPSNEVSVPAAYREQEEPAARVRREGPARLDTGYAHALEEGLPVLLVAGGIGMIVGGVIGSFVGGCDNGAATDFCVSRTFAGIGMGLSGSMLGLVMLSSLGAATGDGSLIGALWLSLLLSGAEAASWIGVAIETDEPGFGFVGVSVAAAATPFIAVLMYTLLEDNRRSGPVSLAPSIAPAHAGATVGLTGAF